MKRIVGIGLCLMIGLSAYARKAASGVEELIDSVFGLEALMVENQRQFFLIAPPTEEVYFHRDPTVVPVDWNGFPKAFTKRMYAEMDDDGFPIYRVRVYEDPFTRQTVFENSRGRAIHRLEPAAGYDPHAWQKAAFNLKAGKKLGDFEKWLYDPARVAVEFTLIPKVFHADYSAIQAERKALEAAYRADAASKHSRRDRGGVSIRVSGAALKTTEAVEPEELAESEGPVKRMMAMSAPPPPGGGVCSPIVELAFTPEVDCGPYVEIFRKQNLMVPQLWDVAVNRMAVTGGVETVWADPVSSNAPAMFYIVGDTSAGIDDGDGYSELRERYVTGTDPAVFNHVDTDSDNLHDWFEIFYFGDLSQSASDDFDGDGLLNNEELASNTNGVVEVVADPANPDTDGDGTGDGDEVDQGSNPSDSSDNGQPPPAMTAVTLSVEDHSPSYLQGGYTMTLSDGTNSYEVVSADLNPETKTFDVPAGRSYTLTLRSHDFPPYSGQYSATVTGAGIAIDDPENILGENHAHLNLYNPGKSATVHVVDTVLKVTHPQDPGPTGSAFKYSNSPNNGSASNLFSTWKDEQFQLEIHITPNHAVQHLPSDYITWQAEDFAVPNNSTNFVFSWSSSGTKEVTVTIDNVPNSIHVHVPDVGTLSQAAAAAAVATVSAPDALLVANAANEALEYANSTFPAGPQRDAFRHAYWMALSVSYAGVLEWQAMLISTGHECDNRDKDHQQAFNSAMDLHNNAEGSTIVHMTSIGVPDRPSIRSEINQAYAGGDLWIWEGGGAQGDSEGILVKSDGTRIHQ